MKTTKTKFLSALSMCLLPFFLYCQQSYNSRITLDTVDCVERKICFQVELKAVDEAWKLGDQIYRIYYDSRAAMFVEGSVESMLLNGGYQNFSLRSHSFGLDASRIEGLLSFEDDLGFINYSIQSTDASKAITVSPDQWLTTSSLCFEYDTLLIEIHRPMSVVLAREEKTTAYARAFTQISSLDASNRPVTIPGIEYLDYDGDGPDQTTIAQTCDEPNQSSALMRLEGRIILHDGTPLSEVTVLADGYSGYEVLTAANGGFAFDLTKDRPYRIVPSKNDGILEGVSSEDILRIMLHIAGIQRFTHPLQYWAADVNADGQIDNLDIGELFAVISGQQAEFQNNSSYIFGFGEFPLPLAGISQPLSIDFVREVVIADFNADMYDQNFMALKIGDVTGLELEDEQPVLDPQNLVEPMTVNPDFDMRLFPNPTSDFVFVQFGRPLSEDASLVITSVDGKTVSPRYKIRTVGNEEPYVIDVSRLPAGLYIALLTEQENFTAQKFVVR